MLDQNAKRQLEGQVLGPDLHDKASGRDTARPELTDLLRFARDGDTVVVHSMDRLARNLDDLRFSPRAWPERMRGWSSSRRAWSSPGRAPPHGQPHALCHGGVRRIRTLPDRRTAAGNVALAKQRGAYKGRKKTLTQERAAELVQRAGSGVPKAILARDYGTSGETVNRYLRHAKLE